jgi:glycosyltransferase involved in cell wall biosynthesis
MRVLESLRKQRTGSSWEVLVIDNASEDETGEAVRDISGHFPVALRAVREERPGLSFARNCAIEHARGDVLVWTDDDVSCDPKWLDTHLAAYSDPKIVAAGGRVRVDVPPGVPDEIASFLVHRGGGPASGYDFGDDAKEIVRGGRIGTPFGLNMSVRTSWARKLGGYREDLGWRGSGGVPGEETEFFGRVLREGGRISYLPDAVVRHHLTQERASLEYLRRWHRRSGRGRVLLKEPLAATERRRLTRHYLRRIVRYTVRMWFARRGSASWLKCVGRRESSLGALSALRLRD